MKGLVVALGILLGACLGIPVALILVEAFSGGNTVAAGMLGMVALPGGLIVGMVIGGVVAAALMDRFRTAQDAVSRRRRLTALLGAIGIVPVAIYAAFALWGWMTGPPSDATMLRHFRNHQGEFEQLVQMITADQGLTRVDETWTSPADPGTIGVSRVRLDTYRTLLRNAGTPRGFFAGPARGGIEFHYWLRGSAVSDDLNKGFAYLNSPPPQTLVSLDGWEPRARRSMTVYRHVEGHWYLFLSFIPG